MATAPAPTTRVGLDKVPDTDLTVEYSLHDGSLSKLWCVFLLGTVLFVDANLDPALDTARRLAVAFGCPAWLITPGSQPIEISPARWH